MLSIGKLAPGQQAYYLDTVARGAEEYWTNAKEAPGQWMGAGSTLLALAGEVDADDLHRVLEHRDPRTGTRLTRAQGAPKVAGFDATFCAPLCRIRHNGAYAESVLMPSGGLVMAVVPGQRAVVAA